MSLPSILIHPPLDESYSDPCLLVLTPGTSEEQLVGLSNPSRNSVVSLCNAMLQLVGALPGINSELPATPSNGHLRLVMQTVHQMHRMESPSVPDRVSVFLHHSLDTPNPIESHSEPSLLLETFLGGLLDSALLTTRFGRRFDMDLVHHSRPVETTSYRSSLVDSATTKDSIGSAVTAYSLTASPSTVTPVTPFIAVSPGKSLDSVLDRHAVRISLASYSPDESVPLLKVLNKHFGYNPPTFFFGRPSKKSIFDELNVSDSSITLKPAMMFMRLPHFLIISLHRPIVTASHLHSTGIEIPFEMDIGSLCHPQASIPASSIINNSHSAKSPTFYRLHGFVTQSSCHFITYTRVRGGPTWFKCDDDSVGPVDLGCSVNSRGVVLLMYRLQDY